MQPEILELDEQIDNIDAIDLDAEDGDGDAEAIEPTWPEDAESSPNFTVTGMNDQFVGTALSIGFTGSGVSVLRRDYDAAIDAMGKQRLGVVAKNFAKSDVAKEAARTGAEVRRLRKMAKDANAVAERKREDYAAAISRGVVGGATKLRSEIDDLTRRAGEDDRLAGDLLGMALEAQRIARIALDTEIRKEVAAIRAEAAERFKVRIKEVTYLVANELRDLLIDDRLQNFDEMLRWMQSGVSQADDQYLVAAGLADEL